MVDWWFKKIHRFWQELCIIGHAKHYLFSVSITTVINKLSYKHCTQYNFGNLTATYCFIELHFYSVVTWIAKERSLTIHPILKHAILKRLLKFKKTKGCIEFLEWWFWLLMNSPLIEKVLGCKFCIFKKKMSPLFLHTR